MFTQLASIVSVLAVASSIQASPTRRADGDNGFCGQLLTTCAASAQALSDPWSVEACLFGATCFGGQRPVDGFLAAVASAKGGAAPASHDVPRVSLATFNKISTNAHFISQQNFIDALYGTLSATNGPFPDASFAISDYQRVAIWTAFCTGGGIPYMNFADYYQFSSTVNSNGCPAVTSSTVTLITPTTTASTTTTFSSPTSTPVSISSEASCNKMFDTCIASVNSAVSDAWSHKSCLFAAACAAGSRPIELVLSQVYFAKTGKSTGAPTALTETRLSTATLNAISTNGQTVTQQNWIDGYYGQLSAVGGPFPVSADVVIADFQRIQQWTVFCGAGGIPFQNIADYYEFASTVSSPNSC